MAGDWIKFQNCTVDKPEIWDIANELNIDPDAVVGKLLRVWIWFDEHTEKGNAPIVTKMLLDRSVGVTGFCNAVIKAKWMLEKNDKISLPNFDRHNGKTAKNRAQTALRVSKHKKNGNGKANGAGVTSALPREEKRREEIKDNSLFESFWSLYPKKDAKKKSKTTFENLTKKNQQLAIEDIKTRYNETDKKFVPLPTTYLNGERWNDEKPQQEKEVVKWT